MNFEKVQLWGNYASNKVSAVNNELMGLIASIDPEGISAAAIDGEIAKLKHAGVEIEQWRRAYTEAHAKFSAADTLNQQRIGSVEFMQGKLSEPGITPEKKASLEKSIAAQMKIIEGQQPELDHLHTMEDNAHATFDALNGAYEAKLEQLNNRKAMFEQETGAQARARAEKESAERRNEAAQVAANLKSSSSSSAADSALAAMKRRTEKLQDEAASLNRMSDGLTPAHPEKTDANIIEAMQQVSGEPPASAQSLSDRLAAIKQKSQGRAHAA